MRNASLLLARIIFWKKFSGSMRKNFHEYGFSEIRTCVLGFWRCQINSVIKETKPKVGRGGGGGGRFHAAPPGNSGVYGEFIKFYQTFVS